MLTLIFDKSKRLLPNDEAHRSPDYRPCPIEAFQRRHSTLADLHLRTPSMTVQTPASARSDAYQRSVLLYLLFMVLLWTILMAISHKAPDLDGMEELVWSASFELGYLKHPLTLLGDGSLDQCGRAPCLAELRRRHERFCSGSVVHLETGLRVSEPRARFYGAAHQLGQHLLFFARNHFQSQHRSTMVRHRSHLVFLSGGARPETG